MQLILSLRLINPISPDGLIDFLQLLWDASCGSSDVITFASGTTPRPWERGMKLMDDSHLCYWTFLWGHSHQWGTQRWMKTAFWCCYCFSNECEGFDVGYLEWRNSSPIIPAINIQKSMIVLPRCQYVPLPLDSSTLISLFRSICSRIWIFICVLLSEQHSHHAQRQKRKKSFRCTLK